VLRALGLKLKDYPFGHNQFHELPYEKSHKKPQGLFLLDSYHCSRYNTQTRRLTTPMFQAVFERARELVDAKA